MVLEIGQTVLATSKCTNKTLFWSLPPRVRRVIFKPEPKDSDPQSKLAAWRSQWGSQLLVRKRTLCSTTEAETKGYETAWTPSHLYLQELRAYTWVRIMLCSKGTTVICSNKSTTCCRDGWRGLIFRSWHQCEKHFHLPSYKACIDSYLQEL